MRLLHHGAILCLAFIGCTLPDAPRAKDLRVAQLEFELQSAKASKRRAQARARTAQRKAQKAEAKVEVAELAANLYKDLLLLDEGERQKVLLQLAQWKSETDTPRSKRPATRATPPPRAKISTSELMRRYAEEGRRLEQAILNRSSNRTSSPTWTGPSVPENGSHYGELSETTFKPKTTYVRGYFRNDGTYVRGHYRSR